MTKFGQGVRSWEWYPIVYLYSQGEALYGLEEVGEQDRQA